MTKSDSNKYTTTLPQYYAWSSLLIFNSSYGSAQM